MSKAGRPKADNPKTFQTMLRLDAHYAERLTEYSKKTNLPRGKVIRNIVENFLDKEEIK